jgi:hypothetical protein
MTTTTNQERDTRGVRLVRQEHPEGCLVACLAMVSGRTYAEVSALFVRDRYEDGGLNDYQVFDFLASEGFFWRHVHCYSHIGPSKEREQWPLPLATDITICRVDAGRGGQLSHGIVVTRDGQAYDPASGLRKFSDYATVGAMTFISRPQYDTGWWQKHEHYDRDGYCDNPARGY